MVEEEEARAKAMNAAMEHAGVTECYTHRIEEDVEHGRAVYEIEFIAGKMMIKLMASISCQAISFVSVDT